MFRASRPVRDLLAKERSGQITFRDSTTIYLASAQSPNARASISIQDLMLDEEALYRQITGRVFRRWSFWNVRAVIPTRARCCGSQSPLAEMSAA
ncbi:hypothetical protein SDC9_135744 [bioreactor metagenome]|uniref:Uncharacterized protein n=1 Tax=bioreactor metagenome TaxID=1076179 RepID=A0A645DGN9_9ZZZZ